MKIRIYKEGAQYILERVNQFNHATKRYMATEKDLLEALDSYPRISSYELIIEEKNLWSVVSNHLNK